MDVVFNRKKITERNYVKFKELCHMIDRKINISCKKKANSIYRNK